MDTLRLILTVVLLGWSVISVITYLARRSDSKYAMRDLRQAGHPTRQITDEERAAALVAYKADVATNADVYQVAGAIRRHGLTANGNTTWHHVIDDLEVTPFPDWDALIEEDNRVEVVLAKKIALPISINGVSLMEALAERARTGRVQEQLREGELGTVLEAPSAQDTSRVVTITASRTETLEEARLRYEGNGSGWACLMWLCCLGIAIASLLSAQAQPWLAVPAVIGAIGSGWMLRQRLARPKLNSAEIRSLRGPFRFDIASIENGTGSTIAIGNPQVGELAVTYPKHWLAYLAQHSDAYQNRVCDIDIDLKNQQVVRHERLSIYDELRRFPVPRWGRHLVMVLGASITLVFSLILARPLDSAVERAVRVLRHPEAFKATTPGALLAQQPQIGDQLSLTGTITCLPSDDDDADRAVIHAAYTGDEGSYGCRRLGWYPDGAESVLPAQSDDLQSLSGLARKIASSMPTSNAPPRPLVADSDIGAMAMLMQRMTENLMAPVLPDFNAHVLEVDRICSPSDSAECSELRNSLAALGDHEDDWSGLLADAKAGKLTDSIRVATDDARILTPQLRSAVAQASERAGLVRFRGISAQQPPMLLLQMDDRDGDGLSLPAASTSPSGEAVPGPASTSFDDALAKLINQPFKLQGTITAIGKNAQGVPEWRIHASAEPPTILARVAPLMLGLFALAMLVLHAVALQRQWSRQKKHAEEVKRYVEQMLPQF